MLLCVQTAPGSNHATLLAGHYEYLPPKDFAHQLLPNCRSHAASGGPLSSKVLATIREKKIIALHKKKCTVQGKFEATTQQLQNVLQTMNQEMQDIEQEIEMLKIMLQVQPPSSPKGHSPIDAVAPGAPRKKQNLGYVYHNCELGRLVDEGMQLTRSDSRDAMQEYASEVDAFPYGDGEDNDVLMDQNAVLVANSLFADDKMED